MTSLSHHSNYKTDSESLQMECSTIDEDSPISKALTRNAIIGESYRWTTFGVYTENYYKENYRRLIILALANLAEALPCVQFGIWKEKPEMTIDYVHIKNGSGCSSLIGKRGGSQDLILSIPGCLSFGTILHEFVHALGLSHEHKRADRDTHISIIWDNIKPGKEHNFIKLSPNKSTTFGVAYNPHSLMHYGSLSFTKNGGATILSKNGGPVGSLGVLQPSDILKLNLLYNCSVTR